MIIYFLLREITIEEYDNDGDDNAFSIKVDKNLVKKNTSKKNDNNGLITNNINNPSSINKNDSGNLIEDFSNIFGAPTTNMNVINNNNFSDFSNIFGMDSNNNNNIEPSKPQSNNFDLLSGFLNNTNNNNNNNQNTDSNNNFMNNNFAQNNNNDLFSNLGLVR